jgi:hypothetical protein
LYSDIDLQSKQLLSSGQRKKDTRMSDDGGTGCDAVDVGVGGQLAKSVTCEFEISVKRSLPELFASLNPMLWAEYGGGLFKSVTPVDPDVATPWSPRGSSDQDPLEHGPWRGTYLEKAELAGERLTNVLNFDVTKTATYVALTFDLVHSLDGRVEIDRGFFLVNDLGNRRRVRALKIIRLADGPDSDFSRVLIDEACPLWGLWIKEVVKGDDASLVAGPGSGGSTTALGAPGAARLLAAVYRHRVLDFARQSTKAYGDYAVEVGSHLVSGTYGRSDAMRDGLHLTWQLARDWARLGGYVIDFARAIEEESRSGPNSGRGLTALQPIEQITWSPPGTGGRVEPGDLKSISPDGTVLPKSRIVVTPTTLRSGPAVQVAVDTTNVPYGMYIGDFEVDGKAVPFQFYVSQAVSTP